MDPFVTRALTEHKSREFSTKSNEMLSLTLKWQEKAREIEVDVFDQIKKCIKTWEDAKYVSGVSRIPPPVRTL